MNTGFVYFKKTTLYANHAAVKRVGILARRSKDEQQPAIRQFFFDKDKTNEYFARIPPRGHPLCAQHEPNVILIVLRAIPSGSLNCWAAARIPPHQ